MEELRAKKIKGPGGLREEAKKYGVKYASKMSKEELVDSILNSEVDVSRDDLVSTAKELGITSIAKKNKEKLISEIRFKMYDTADRFLHERSYYEDKSDEELVKDMFCISVAALKKYSVYNNLGYLYGYKKVNFMESLFVNIRAGCSSMLFESIKDPGFYPSHLGIRDKTVNDLLFYEDFSVLLKDHKECWDREELLSFLIFLGCYESKVKNRSKEELLSLLIKLECCTFYYNLYGDEVTRVDLRKRFYIACEKVAKQAFFINANRAKNSKKGKRLAKQMEERDMYFERGIGWVSMYDDY